MKRLLLTLPMLAAAACSSSAPGAPTSVSGQGGTAAASPTSFSMTGIVTVVGTPAPGSITAQVAGGPAVPVDANGRFQLPAVPATATSLTVRVDGRESIARFPMSPLTGPQLLIELRVDASTGVAAVARLCSTSAVDTTPGTAAIVSMCVSGS